MSVSYTIKDGTLYSTIKPNIIIVGFKRTNEYPEFHPLQIEVVLDCGDSTNPFSTDGVRIGGLSIEEYIRELNGTLLVDSTDSLSIEQYQLVEGLRTMTCREPTIQYLLQVLYSVIGSGVTISSNNIKIDQISILPM